MTLNMAHGRKDGFSQIFLSKAKIRSNLDDIVLLLKKRRPDLVALQEADSLSIWSGHFNHIAYIAEQAGYNYSVSGDHVKGMMLSYGTALLSQSPFSKPLSVTFPPSPPTSPKGFVSAVVNISDKSAVMMVSVHLDFFSKNVRESQVREMIKRLSSYKQSLIVMGDFNCEGKKGSAVNLLSEKLNLSVYKTGSINMITFPALKKQLDYILISKGFEFVKYKVVKDIVSDHFGVISEIKIR